MIIKPVYKTDLVKLNEIISVEKSGMNRHSGDMISFFLNIISHKVDVYPWLRGIAKMKGKGVMEKVAGK